MQINVVKKKAWMKKTMEGVKREKRRIVNIKEVTRLNDRKGQLFKKDAKINAREVGGGKGVV